MPKRTGHKKGENEDPSFTAPTKKTRSTIGIYTIPWFINDKISDGKWFEPRGISYLFGVIVWVKAVFRKIVVGD